MSFHLAVDIGASSGRCVLGWLKDSAPSAIGSLCIEEIHRFPNKLIERNGHLCWDINALFNEIITGLRKCKDIGKIPQAIGIDTWAVDFVLLDKNGNVLGDTVAYRDKRTEGCDIDVYAKIPEAEIFSRTGIQKQLFNTIYQLRAVQRDNPAMLDNAEHFLMLPDYLHYKLCGEFSNEYTNATSTGLVNAKSKQWDKSIIETLGFPPHLFKPLTKPATLLGKLSANIIEAIGFNCEVITPVTHDTPSAIMAVPSNDSIYISSGTWSLMGIETDTPICSEETRQLNFTNEGGFNNYCFRKNIMGLWLINEAKRELNCDFSFAQLCESAEAENIPSIIEANNNRFFSPNSMTAEIKAACFETDQKPPETPAQFARVIYRSLAHCYAETVREIETLSKRKFDVIHIVGGGANADYLNRLITETTGKTVRVNPTEASAIGNITAQMITCGKIKDLNEARELIAGSFNIKEYNG